MRRTRRLREQGAAVLDASALLAVLLDEPGRAMVEPILADAAISAVNWSEIQQKLSARLGAAAEGVRAGLEAYGLVVEPFTAADADVAARLWTKTRSSGLSLADRACVALAVRLGCPLFTADRVWAKLDLGVKVTVIR